MSVITRYGLFAAGAFVLLIGAWSVRLKVTEEVLHAALAFRGEVAELRVTGFNINKLVIENVRVGPDSDPKFLADLVEVDFRLTEAFAGSVRAISANTVEARAEISENQLYLFGLPEPWARPRTLGPSAPLPAVSVSNLRVYLDTVAGQLVFDGAFSGDRRKGWSLNLNATPAQVGSPDSVLTITEGAINAELNSEIATVTGRFMLSGLVTPRLRADTVAVDLDLNGVMLDPADFNSLSLTGSIGAQINQAGLQSEAAQNFADQIAPHTSGAVAVALEPHLSMARQSLIEFVGGANFDGVIDLLIADGQIEALWAEPLVLSDNAGEARLAVSHEDVGLVGVFADRKVLAENLDLDLAGSGLPHVSARMSRGELLVGDGGELALDVQGNLSVDPWDVDALAVAMNLDFARFISKSGEWSLVAAGRAGADGQRSTNAIRGLGLDFDLELTSRDGQIRLIPRQGAEQRVSLQRALFGDIVLRDVEARISEAGVGRAFVRRGSDGVFAAARLNEMDVFAARPSVLGVRLRAPAAELSFEAPQGGDARADARLQGPRIEGLLNDGRQGRLESRILNIRLGFQDQLTLSGLFEVLSLSGKAVPVEIDDAAGEIQLVLAAGEVASGEIAIARAELRDRSGGGRFSSFRTALSGVIEGDRFEGGGWLKDSATGEDLADLTINANLADRTGVVQFASPLLNFTPGEFTPGAVFPRLQRMFPEARGGLQVSGEVRRDQPEGPVVAPLIAQFADFSFDADFGRVVGVSGVVNFTDALDLRTNGPQDLSVGVFDPGLPLSDGQVRIDLTGDDRIVISSARFTIADGTATLDPFSTSLNASQHDGVVRITGVDLSRAAQLFRASELRMEGVMSGAAPFSIDQRTVSLQDAQLRSDGGGRIRLREGQPQSGISADPGLADLLRNFSFERLSLSADGALDGTLVVGLAATGGGRSVNSAFTVELDQWTRE